MLAVFDGLLLLMIVVLAWRSLNDRDQFRAVVKFIAFGLLLAVAWVRLRAPDVALAEAAVGSGLTGALLLSALVRMRRREKGLRRTGVQPSRAGQQFRWWAGGLLSLALLAALGWAVRSLPSSPTGLTAESLAQLDRSGVTNPVTAALLNYRGYDTLLEVGVLLLAIIGVWSLRRAEWPVGGRRGRPLLLSLLRLLLPMLVLAAGYLLWIGAFAPGGAFQAGALLGGALVLVLLGGLAGRFRRRDRWQRRGLAFGVLVFAGVGVATQWLTGRLLEYPAGTAGSWILVIESAALISIGWALGALYLGGRPGLPPEAAAERRPAPHA